MFDAKVDAVWVGWGFVSEDIGFVELCARLSSPSSGRRPRRCGSWATRCRPSTLAEKVGVPVAPWSGGPVETREDARRHADAIGYPMILKARSGGGGRGIRMVFSPDELEDAIERTQAEAERSFDDPVIFLERWSSVPGTSRSRSSPTTTATSGRPESGTAPSSAATRS